MRGLPTRSLQLLSLTHKYLGGIFYLMPMQADPLESYQQKLQSTAHLSV